VFSLLNRDAGKWKAILRLRDAAWLLLLGAIWGGSYLFIRVASPVLRPFPLVFIRLALGGGVLLAAALMMKRSIPWRRHGRSYLIAGLVNCALPFSLISIAALNLTASFSAMLNATTPIFTAVIAAFWLKDRLTTAKIVGLTCGLLGVAVIVGWQPTPLDAVGLLSAGMLIASSVCYAAGAVYSKKVFQNADPISTSVGQLLSGGIWVLPLALVDPPRAALTPAALASALGLGLLSTAFGYLIYFRLLNASGATATASVTFLIPFFSSVWGAVVLGETIHANEVIGFGAILVGLTLVTEMLARRSAPAGQPRTPPPAYSSSPSTHS
jgi:drug/metabolite transporter (DMT)-like permease